VVFGREISLRKERRGKKEDCRRFDSLKPLGREKGGCSRAKYREGDEQFSSLIFFSSSLRSPTLGTPPELRDTVVKERKRKEKKLASLRIKPRCNESKNG